MSPYHTPSPERAVTHLDRRALLQITLIAPFAVPYGARAAGAQSTALDPIVALNNGLLAVMKAGSSVPFLDRYNTLSRVRGKYLRPAGNPAPLRRLQLEHPGRARAG